MDAEAFLQSARELGLELTEEQLEGFEQFEEALYEANSVMNLTRVPREECWLRHFLDSLLFQDQVPRGYHVLDVGTGPGFPAWPLACARPDLKLVALDSSGKMLGFLRTQPLPNLKPHQSRAEELGTREKFDVVTGRAVAPLGIQLELSAAPLNVGGILIPMRTTAEREQLQADVSLLGLELEKVVERELPGTGILRLFPIYRKVKATPGKYPRPWAEIKRKPLLASA